MKTTTLEKAHFRSLLFLFVLTGLVLRVVVCSELAGHRAIVNPIRDTDMATYLRLSREICSGQWPDHFDYQPFYYTVFLPFCRLLGGDSPWPIMLLQAIMGAAAVWLTGVAAAQLFGRRAGLLAAALLALCRAHVFYTPFALFEVMQSFWTALLLWLALLCWKGNRPWQWCLTALMLSCATLTRGNALLLLPLFLALLIWRNWRQMRACWLALAFLVLFELPQLPFGLRNWHYTGRWVGASTAGEKVLVLGNSPEAPAGGLQYPATYEWWVGEAERRPSEGRVGVAGRILRWMCREPLAFLDLEFRKCLLFWDKMEIPNNVSLLNEGKHSALIRNPVLFPFALLGPLALFGLFRASRATHERASFLLGMLLLCWLGTALFYILSRFRVCTLPLICVYAGVGVRELLALPKRAGKQPPLALRPFWGTVALTALLAVFLCDFAYERWCHSVLPMTMRIQRPVGQYLEFPDICILRDNGPVLEPGRYTLAFCDSVNVFGVEKRLMVPNEQVGRPCIVRLPVTLLDNIPGVGSLEVDGVRHRVDESSVVRSPGGGRELQVKLPGVSAQ
ncbi:MAG: glycosyltransferase family 39 protein, partial [Victivallales bacterium]|nr:glycosyltransferase family 39 protein [Victivallales bacterium]